MEMKSTDEEVLSRKISTMFPNQQERIRHLLSGYGKEESEREATRTQLAVLKLSGGGIEKLEYYLREAKKDYRDVLAWAEYPEQIRARTWELDQDEKKRMQERDLEQYRAWIDE